MISVRTQTDISTFPQVWQQYSNPHVVVLGGSQSLHYEPKTPNNTIPQRISVLHCSLNTNHKADLLTCQAEVISLISAVLSPDEEVVAHKAESFILPLCGALSF